MSTIPIEDEPDIDGWYKFEQGRLIRCSSNDLSLVLIKVTTCDPPVISLISPDPATPPDTPPATPSILPAPDTPPVSPLRSDSPLYWHAIGRRTGGDKLWVRQLSRRLFSNKARDQRAVIHMEKLLKE